MTLLRALAALSASVLLFGGVSLYDTYKTKQRHFSVTANLIPPPLDWVETAGAVASASLMVVAAFELVR